MMKKLLLSLALVAFAATAMNAQTAPQQDNQVKKECCKEMKDGKKCDKPADQQCPDCKAQAEGKKCDKAEGMKHECKKAEGKKCDKAEGMKHECKKAEGKKCDKAEGMKHECKKAEGQKCEKEKGMKLRDKANLMKKPECKDHKDGQKCDKPADQQCPDCKEAAKKN